MHRTLFILFALVGCSPQGDARQATVVQVLTRADEVMLRSRPELSAGKYARMAAGPFDFYRGSLALFRADWEAGRTSQSGFLTGTPPVLGLGDPHPENFGLLMDRDGGLALEPNDFDSADRVPYLLDVRRLTTGLALAARMQRPDEDPVDLARATALSYATTFIGLADGGTPERITDGHASVVIEDLFRRGARDRLAHAELVNLTEVDDAGVRRFLRGADPTEPTAVIEDVKPQFVDGLPEILARLGPSTRVLDAVRQYGSGVASWPRLRFLVLLEGDVVVEVKELSESSLAGWYRPALVARDTPSRVEAAARRAWAMPDADPRWFTTSWQGLPLQVRTEAEAQKGVKVERLVGARGTPEALSKFGAVLGALLARVHARSEPEVVAALAAQLARDPQAFADEQAAFASAESVQVLEDFARFQDARLRLGPLLGVVNDARDRPVSLADALFGSPPVADADGGSP